MLPCYGYERPLSLFALDYVDQTKVALLKAAISGIYLYRESRRERRGEEKGEEGRKGATRREEGRGKEDLLISR